MALPPKALSEGRSIVRDAELDAFKRDTQNYQKAASRITATAAFHGGPEPAAVAWLLSFLAHDVATLNEWQRDEAFWNVLQFTIDGGQGWFTDLGILGATDVTYPDDATDRMMVLARIQKATRACLTDYLTKGVGTFPEGEGSFVISGVYRMAHYNGGDLAASFYYMAAQLLSKYKRRVKRCEGCPLLMLVGRKDQRFHSQSCQIATFVRNKRAKDKAARLATEAAKELRARRKKNS